MKNEHKAIDFFKLFFSFCVVAIHAGLFFEFKFGYYLKTLILRLAVPYFFLCNGYFLAQKKGNDKEIAKKQIKKLLPNYIIFGILFSVMYNLFELDTFNIMNLYKSITELIILKPITIMWYVATLIIFYIAAIHLNFPKNIKKLIITFACLYILGIIIFTYNPKINTDSVSFVIFIKKFFYNPRCAIFTLLFPLLGYYIGYNKIEKGLKKQTIIIFFVISMICFFMEAKSYYPTSLKYNEYDFMIFTPIVSTLLFLLIINSNLKSKYITQTFRIISQQLFYYHYIFVYILYYFKRKYNLCNLTSLCKSYFNFFNILLLTFTLILIINYIKKKRGNK